MKNLILLSFFCFVAFFANAQQVEFPVRMTDTTAFFFSPTNLVLRQIGGGSFSAKTINFYFEISDSLQDAKNSYPREMKIKGNIEFPASVFSACFSSNGTPVIPAINQVLAGFGLVIDDRRQIKMQ